MPSASNGFGRAGRWPNDPSIGGRTPTFDGETPLARTERRCTASGRDGLARVGRRTVEARRDVAYGMDTGLGGGETVLYLGAAAGTTVSHVADFGGPTYAVEFAPRPVRELLDAAESRRNLFPLLKDARKPRATPTSSNRSTWLYRTWQPSQARVATLN
ncbi:hypothetical protein C8039_04500 [Halogeometricum sp. wsp3]|nr:hypothetical protein C8039_04500 [Halogeometricum sp. wsp3]